LNRDGQEDQLGALGFALNALMLWNAQYLDDAIAQLRATGHQITDEDLRRLSPLQHEHIKMLGHFPFALPHELVDGHRRQLSELVLAAWRTFPVPVLPGGQLRRSGSPDTQSPRTAVPTATTPGARLVTPARAT
jgi:hypothetical protein